MLSTRHFSLLLFAFFVLTFTTSCGDDEDDCMAPELSANIVGSWNATTGAATFQADGTLIDPDDAIIGAEINGVVYTRKSYSVNQDTLTVVAMPPTGSGMISSDFVAIQNECNRIVLDIGLGAALTETLNRQ
ncbi:MAG: hypothetical protein AAF828_04575 [Bacteroidota bacterium]